MNCALLFSTFFFFKAPETSHLPFGMFRDWNSRGEFSVGEIILLYWVITGIPPASLPQHFADK